MIDIGLAHLIYRFKNQPVNESQDSASVNRLCTLIQKFSTRSDIDANYRRVTDQLAAQNEGLKVSWHGEYGCSWLAIRSIGSSREPNMR